MLSVSPIKGDAGYYGKEDNYYVSGSLDDRWLGKGAEQLGLDGRVDPSALDAIMAGKLPDGADLARMEAGRNTHRAGYDLTFSAPKGVSMAILIGGDKGLLEAHNRAVSITMGEVERLVTARITENGKTETVATGSMLSALFTHDTSRELEPQIHTHALVLNATFAEGKWRSLASDTRMKTGFSEAIYNNKIAIGNIYRTTLRSEISEKGYETEDVGPHGLWDLKNVPTEEFSTRSAIIREAVGPDASAKSRDIAALDTRKPKSWADAELLVKSWHQRLGKHHFDMAEYVSQAAERARQGGVTRPEVAAPVSVMQAVGDAISALSDKKIQFTLSELLSGTVNRLPAQPGVFEQARAGIDEALTQQRLIPLDREKGIFTSDIHLLNELSVQQLAQNMVQAQRAEVFPDRSVPRTTVAGDAVSVLSQDRSRLAIISGKGGARAQRERITDVAEMAREQGREVVVLATDRRSGQFLQENEQLQGSIMQRGTLDAGSVLPVHGTLIVEQAEKLTLKEMLLVLEKGQASGTQVILMDAQNRSGTGNALSVLRSSDVAQYRTWTSRQPDVTLVSEPDKQARADGLARDWQAAVRAGQDVVAQVDGVDDQKLVTRAIRGARREAGELGDRDVKIDVIEPVWLDSRSRRQRDNYRPGMVMEQWNSESRSMTRYRIDRVADSTHSLVLVSEHGERQVQKIGKLDGSWSLYRPRTLDVSEGDALRVLGREARGALRASERYTVSDIDDRENRLVLRAGEREVVLDTTRALKLAHDYVEGTGSSVSAGRQILAMIPGRGLTADTLTRLSRSGSDIRIYTPLEQAQAEKKVLSSPVVRLASERVMADTGETDLSGAMTVRHEQLMNDAELAVSLAIPLAQNGNIQMSRVSLLSNALVSGVPLPAIHAEIQRQTDAGDLVHLPSVAGAGNDMLVPRVALAMETAIIRTIAEGKDAVSPLMSSVPENVLKGLTRGQTVATRLILESPDRFLGVQGYAGVGKTTQYRAVMKAINQLPAGERPKVTGLGPTHRAVSEMRAAGVPAQTLASFLSEHRQAVLSDEKPDFSQTLFLTDESSMIGNRDMAELYQIVAAGGGRMVSSGDEAQLQPIAAGTPFRLTQQRSAADVAIMQEIVRQTPELRPAVERVIARDVEGSLAGVNAVAPSMVPRQRYAWIPEQSVMEIKTPEEGERPVSIPGKTSPETAVEAIILDWRGRTAEARAQTLIVAQLNADRRAINDGIHQARREDGTVGSEERTLSVLSPVRVPEGSLRSVAGFEAHTGRTAMMNHQYYTVLRTDAKAGVVHFMDREGGEVMISVKQNTAQDIALYETRELRISEGDRVLFNRTDTDRGYVANDIWQVGGFAEDGSIRFVREGQEKRLNPLQDDADRHIDLAYAVTVNGAQGASAPLVIGLTGSEGGRGRMASLESWYVTLSRAVTHMQLYTDNREGWIAAMARAEKRMTAHDLLHQQDDSRAGTASWLLEKSVSLEKTGLGRQVLNTAQLAGDTLARFIGPGKKYPAPHMALPVWNQHGKERGVLMTEIRLGESGRQLSLGDDHRLLGAEDAHFAGLQTSRNGETLLAADFDLALQLARENPESGVVIRLGGEEPLQNALRLTGGKIDTPLPDIPVERKDDIPALPEAEKAEDLLAQDVQDLLQTKGSGERLTDIVHDVVGELREEARKLNADLSPEVVARAVDQAIEQVVSDEARKQHQSVALRLQQQEREWVPEQEHSLEKTLGE